MNWYVMHVLTGKELDVRKCLFEEGYKTLVPRRKLKERKSGEWRYVERTLFPGYVFVKTSMQEKEYYKFKATTGVIKILKGASDIPVPVDDEEMKIVYRLTSKSELVEISDIFYDGLNVKVISGPLQGYEGNILKVDRRRFRAKVNFTIAGKETIIELGVNVLDKV